MRSVHLTIHICITTVAMETIHCVCIVELRHCRQYQNNVTGKCTYNEFTKPFNNKTSFGVHVSVRYFFPEFNQTLEFLHRFPRKSAVSNFAKIRPMGAGPIEEANGRFSRLHVRA